MRNRVGLLALLVVAVLLGCANSAFAQVSASVAQLNGTILDESGGSVAKASISVREMDTNLSYTVTSNDTGFYVAPNLPPGRYELKVSFTGFANYTETGIELRVGQTATINITLKVAARGEQVVVSTEVPTIEPTKTEISQVIDTQQIQDLPTNNRRFTDFALLTPAVATSRTSVGTTFTEFEATQISFGGMRSFSNEITVDGADFVNSNSGLQRSTPPQESVQEFRVVNNSFGADYGRALGGIVNIVTKSGSNELHGSVYDYLQNNALDARSLLQPAPEPFTLRQNQFGATIGGPIQKNKTFFFANYEGQRQAQSPTFPTDLLSNIAGIDNARAYLGLAPEGCYASLASCIANGQTGLTALNSTLQTANNDYGFVRIDHQFNNNNRLALRYNVEDGRDTGELIGVTEDGGGIGTPSGGRDLFVRDQSVVGTLNSVLSPTLVNTVLGQFSRRHYNFPGEDGQPDLDVPNDLSFGHNFGTFDQIFESRFEASDSVTWVKGSHVAKFGYDFNYIWDFTTYPGFEPERIILPNLNCLVEFANFVDEPGGPALPSFGGGQQACPLPNGTIPGLPFINEDGVAAVLYGVALARTGYQDGLPPLSNQFPLNTSTWANAFAPQLTSSFGFKLNHGYQGLFAQDQWRLTPKLTVNYGLRWDFETGLGKEIASYYGAFQPRVGFAYSPDGRTVVRAGFGIFFDRNNLTFFNVTGNQKTIPGFLPGINLPMIQTQAASGGWQLNQVVTPSAVPPPVPCPAGQSPFPGGPCFGSSAAIAQSILETGLYPTQFITDQCLAPTASGGGGGACTAGAGGIDRHISKLPYAEQASLEIDRQIGRGTTIQIGYLFVGSHRLVQGNGINVSCPVGTSKPGNPPTAQGLLDPSGKLTNCSGTATPLFGKPFFNGLEFNDAGFMDYNDDVDNANYNGLTVTVVERMGRYFNLTSNYTYSHTFDDGNFTTFINLPQNQFNQQAEYASSNQDVRHRFVTNFTANAPQRSFLRNFQFSSIITMESGRPFTPFVGFDANNDTNAYTDRPGNLGRNSYVGDPLYAWDLRVSRYFQIREHMRLDLMFDAFNALNRPNVNEVVDVYGAPEVCGPAPQHFGDAASRLIQSVGAVCQVVAGPANAPAADGAWLAPSTFAPPPNPFFGTPRTMLNPRQLQFSAKFAF